MDQTLVLEERVGAVAILKLNRPDVMNSFNFAMLRELTFVHTGSPVHIAVPAA